MANLPITIGLQQEVVGSASIPTLKREHYFWRDLTLPHVLKLYSKQSGKF